MINGLHCFRKEWGMRAAGGTTMDQDEEIRRLLQEIRDAQREHLAEYRRVAERSLEIQERAVARQEQAGRLVRQIVLVGGILATVLLALLVYILARWSRYLFGF